MSEDKGEYTTEAQEALDMLGKGYASAEIEQPRTVIERRDGKLESVERPAFVKLSTAFKQELETISGDALKVWLFISLSINRNSGKANPGLRTISAKVGLAINTVQKALKELETLNLLAVDRASSHYNIYEVPEYVSANRSEPTVSNGDTPLESVSNGDTVVSNSAPTVFKQEGNFYLTRLTREPDMLDAILESERANQPMTQALIAFESAFGVNSWPWDTGAKWQKFSKWVFVEYQRDAQAFDSYVQWRKGAGKYQAMSNNKIRQDPQMFMDTGWPTFLASESMYGQKETDQPKAFPTLVNGRLVQ